MKSMNWKLSVLACVSLLAIGQLSHAYDGGEDGSFDSSNFGGPIEAQPSFAGGYTTVIENDPSFAPPPEDVTIAAMKIQGYVITYDLLSEGLPVLNIVNVPQGPLSPSDVAEQMQAQDKLGGTLSIGFEGNNSN